MCPSFYSQVVHWYVTAAQTSAFGSEGDSLRWTHVPFVRVPTGCIASTVSSPNQHLLRTDDVISCCLDLSAPSISFRINGQPVQGMFENFNIDGLFFPVVSFSAGIKLVCLCLCCFPHLGTLSGQLPGMCPFTWESHVSARSLSAYLAWLQAHKL